MNVDLICLFLWSERNISENYIARKMPREKVIPLKCSWMFRLDPKIFQGISLLTLQK
jgi:hypothetical protein